MAELIDSLLAEIEELKSSIAASQAREKVLRDAIEVVVEFASCVGGSSSWWDETWEQYDGVHYQPTDDTALKAALAAERERCAKKAEKLGIDLAELNENNAMKFAGGSIACAIRALGDE